MNTRKFSLGLAAGAALLAATPAFATGGTFKGTGSVDFTPSTGHGTFFDEVIPAGAFTDTITFTTTSNSLLNNIFFDFATSGFTSLTATIDGHAMALGASPLDPVNAKRYSFSGLSTLAGVNTLKITGVSTGGGLFSSIYTGSVKFTAVPEPAAWMLMIGGLGLAGTALRRRKSTVTLRFA